MGGGGGGGYVEGGERILLKSKEEGESVSRVDTEEAEGSTREEAKFC